MRALYLSLVLSLASACALAPQATPTVPPPTATVAPTITPAPTASPAPTEDRVANWRADLQTLASSLKQFHPNLFWRTSEAEFETMVAALEAGIPSLSDAEIITEFSRLVSVADGHSMMPLFQEAIDFQLYPLHLYQFEDGLYIVGADEAHAGAVGQKIVQIGGMSAAEAYALAAPLVPHDSEWGVALLAPVYLAVPEVLLALGIVDDPSQPGFVLEGPDGARTTLDLEPISSADYRWWLSTHLTLAGLPQSPEPLWLSRKADEYYWYAYLEDSDTLYIQYNLVMEATQSGQNIYQFANEVDAFATEHEVERTIVDIRHNLGGDNYGPLARVLRENPHINQPGRLYVLIGRQTFSAAICFSVKLETTTHALFVGEPTGGPPNFYTSHATLPLPHSGIEVLVSGQYAECSTPDDTRPWLEPDLPVTLTAADYFAGRDPVLEVALAAEVTE